MTSNSLSLSLCVPKSRFHTGHFPLHSASKTSGVPSWQAAILSILCISLLEKRERTAYRESTQKKKWSQKSNACKANRLQGRTEHYKRIKRGERGSERKEPSKSASRKEPEGSYSLRSLPDRTIRSQRAKNKEKLQFIREKKIQADKARKLDRKWKLMSRNQAEEIFRSKKEQPLSKATSLNEKQKKASLKVIPIPLEKGTPPINPWKKLSKREDSNLKKILEIEQLLDSILQPSKLNEPLEDSYLQIDRSHRSSPQRENEEEIGPVKEERDEDEGEPSLKKKNRLLSSSDCRLLELADLWEERLFKRKSLAW